MPRKIPWLTAGTDNDGPTRTKSEGSGTISRARRKLNLDSDESEDAKAHQTSPYRKKIRVEDRRRSRTPSTSPPHAPPPEDFMRSGYRQDDLYRMVEDEFYTIAQKFTSHLHFAEYKRLKNETKQKSFETILAMRRPVDGRTPLSAETKRKREAKEQARRTGKAVKDLTAKARDEGDEDPGVQEEEEPWMGASLHGLMSGERKKLTALVGLDGVKSDTKASKGFGSPRRKDRNVKSLFRSPTNKVGPSRHRQSINHEAVHDDDDDSEDLAATGITTTSHFSRAPASVPVSSRSPDQHAQRLKEIFSSSPSSSSSKKVSKAASSTTRLLTTTTKPYSSTSTRETPPHILAPGSSRRAVNIFLDDDDDDDLSMIPSSNATGFDRTEHAGVKAEESLSSPPPSSSSGNKARFGKGVFVEMRKGPEKGRDKGKGKARLDDIPLFLG